jgi:hypothetical protein
MVLPIVLLRLNALREKPSSFFNPPVPSKPAGFPKRLEPPFPDIRRHRPCTWGETPAKMERAACGTAEPAADMPGAPEGHDHETIATLAEAAVWSPISVVANP